VAEFANGFDLSSGCCPQRKEVRVECYDRRLLLPRECHDLGILGASHAEFADMNALPA
jgi:hypothetical protein